MYNGVYPAKVYSIADPLQLGRIQMYVPQIFQDNPVTIWAPPLFAGGATPNLGDVVWCQFQGGDSSYPTYLPAVPAIISPPNAHCRVYRNSPWPTTGSFVNMPYDTIDHDYTDSYDLPSQRFTCPVDGNYLVTARIMTTTTAANGYMEMYVFRYGSVSATYRGAFTWAPIIGLSACTLSTVIEAFAGDQFVIGYSVNQNMTGAYGFEATYATFDLFTGPTGPAGPQGAPGAGGLFPPDTWHDLPLVSPFVNYSSVAGPPWKAAQYTRSTDGWVRLRGLLIVNASVGAGSQSVMVPAGGLPVGYRPVADRHGWTDELFTVNASTTNGYGGYSRLDVSVNGGLILTNAVVLPTNGYVGISGVQWSVVG